MKYRSTMNACFTGYIVQAIVNNFVPPLFVTFQNSWHIPLSRITMLITVNFISSFPSTWLRPDSSTSWDTGLRR